MLTSHFYSGEIADAWSCGVMLFAMLFGAYPFERLCDQYRPGPSAIREVSIYAWTTSAKLFFSNSSFQPSILMSTPSRQNSFQ